MAFDLETDTFGPPRAQASHRMPNESLDTTSVRSMAAALRSVSLSKKQIANVAEVMRKLFSNMEF